MPSPRTTTAATKDPSLALTLADLRGLSQLAFDATLGVTSVVEQLHRTISDLAAPLGRERPPQTNGITGVVYRAVRGTTRLLSNSVDTALRWLEPSERDGALSPRREAVLAVVNGVWGDHLAATGNPLAIPMAIRVDGRPLALSAEGILREIKPPRRRVAVLIHGLCMNDLQWQHDGHHHGRMLEDDLGYSALVLHYNSGRHVSENGEDLARLLQALVDAWPVPLDELVLLGHSMGGLVARAACRIAEERGFTWRQRLTRLVCMATPHHGAVLERGGHLVDTLLAVSPYAAPFARLGKLRSAGITDLRFGNVQHADWQGRDPCEQRRDDRVPTPLPECVAVYLLAATTAAQPRGLRHALVGDGLVSLSSAWGEHRDRKHALHVPPSHRALVTRASHWDLLSHPQAAAALRRWLA